MKHNGWITLAEQYLKTSKLIMEQIKINKNKWFMIDDKLIEWNNYLESTKWSDFNTFVPALFLMQHGLELLLKGLYTLTGNEVKQEHYLTNIITSLEYYGIIDDEITQIIKNYVGDKPKNKLFIEFNKLNNHLDIKKLHINLRYPESKGSDINFSSFRYKEENLIPEVDILINDIDTIFNKSLDIARNYEHNAG